jgi:hypothetical protein
MRKLSTYTMATRGGKMKENARAVPLGQVPASIHGGLLYVNLIRDELTGRANLQDVRGEDHIDGSKI